MIIFSNCKINLGLNIVSRRNDGYHNIETVFYPLPLYDVLELIDTDHNSLTLKGTAIPGNISDNIILKAYHLLKKDYKDLPPVHFYLLKNIPPGAGLGAGSANGAYALIGLNKKFNLNLSTQQLLHYALQLGSDCPFFVINKPCFATGRGEELSEMNIGLSSYQLIIVNPGIHISTPWAFQQLQPAPPTNRLNEITQLPVNEWKNTVTNDFESAVFKTYPEVGAIKNKMYDAGAVFALMSGTGSTVYGLFEKSAPPALNLADHYFIKKIDL